MRQWRQEKKAKDPIWWNNYLAKKREEYKIKKKKNPTFYADRQREYAAKRRKREPEWNAKRQREFREKHPEKFNLIMAKSYLRKLTPEQKKIILKMLEGNRG
jgi:hypothetical protein